MNAKQKKAMGYSDMKKILENQVSFPIGAESEISLRHLHLHWSLHSDILKKHHIGVCRTDAIVFIAALVEIICWNVTRRPFTNVF